MKLQLLHAFAALLALMLFIVRQKNVSAGICRSSFHRASKKRQLEPSSGDTFVTALVPSFADCMVCNRSRINSCVRPKYKRDPDISVDNECIGQHPHDN